MWLFKFFKVLYYFSLKSSDFNLGNGYIIVYVWEIYVLRCKYFILGVNF